MKYKERLRNGSRLKNTKGTWQSNVTCDPGGVLDQETISYKGHQWGNWQNVNMDCVGWIVSMLYFLILIIVLLCKSVSLFLRSTH